MENKTVSVHSNDHWDCPVESCYKYIVSCYCKANEFIPNIFAEKLNLSSLTLLTSQAPGHFNHYIRLTYRSTVKNLNELEV